MEFGTQFQGKGVVVTGALGLFGRGIAKAFADVGAKICVTDRDEAALKTLVEEFGVEGSFAHVCDLTSAEDMDGLIAAVGEAWGAPDILINNAGIYPSGFLLDIDVDAWDQIMDVNLRAPFHLSRGFALQMIEAKKTGSFVNVSSGAARKMRRTVVPYCVSKTALDRLTKGFAIELAEFGIRVNALEPGFAAGSTVSSLSEEHVTRAIKGIPLGRATSMDDIGPATLYLSSQEASFVTGTTLSVDGGNSAGTLDVFQDKKAPL
ncbi:SDR family oxidoreductase [Roseibium sp. CAU 1637]|uniref:SDR family oxidoreductase n=1 Tax=Roseibium limicola TaxID=2816037 RepID=A0A939ELH8_9HYPH|nr:SDR family oxidoreductase [Roseibium limicola]MBO0344340.1 SDR family oxidoreductase [Roseibium limicola]